VKVFWWQCGLHVEPENQAESDALILIWQSIRKTDIWGGNGPEDGDQPKEPKLAPILEDVETQSP